jgi:predicted nucleic acid-binding protein
MVFVLDNSVALAWCFADEQTPAVMALLERTVKEGAVAPSLWPLEAVNALFVAQRKRRITREQRTWLTLRLAQLPIEIDHGPRDGKLTTNVSSLFHPVEILCERYDLTAYDAAYLALALRRKLPLATRDKALIAAAEDQGLLLLETL